MARQREFHKLKAAIESAGHTLPTRRELEKKATQIEKINNQQLTEVRPRRGATMIVSRLVRTGGYQCNAGNEGKA